MLLNTHMRLYLKDFFWKNPMVETVTLNANISLQGRGGVEKSLLRYISTKWMTPKKCCRIFIGHWYDQVH